MKIALAGGLTAGPIIPLLAVADYISTQRADASFVIFDVAGSVGERLAAARQINFVEMPIAKWRRYASLTKFCRTDNVCN